MKTYTGELKLNEDNRFLTYPRDMMEDINDAFSEVVIDCGPDAILDYDIDELQLTLTLSEVGKKNWRGIKELIAKM